MWFSILGPMEVRAESGEPLLHRLRGALGQSRIESSPGGYRIVVERSELDSLRFEDLAADAGLAASRGGLEKALDLYDQAIGLWRGSAYEGLGDVELLRTESARLEEIRLTCLEERYQVALSLGGHDELIASLTAEVGRHPLRERLRGLLMLALYRAGRSAHALEVYRAGRELLAEELGIEPGPELRQLHQAILTQDRGLDLDSDSQDSGPHPSTMLATREFTAPAERVWEHVVDWPNQDAWMTFSRAVVLSGSGVGMELEARTELGPIRLVDRMVVTEWDPPRLFGIRHLGPVVRGTGTVIIEPLGPDQCRLTWHDALSAGPFASVWRQYFQVALHRLATLVE